jgi:hypothetical protein
MLLACGFALLLAIQTITVSQQAAPPAPPRDAPPERPGTAVIRGRVTAADTGLPLRRAFVTLQGGPPMSRPQTPPPPGTPAASVMLSGPRNMRSVATNADGSFEFTALAAGTYRLRASAGAYRGHYLALAFGARTSMDPGKPIELAAGQQFEANIGVPRGGAIVGRVVDDFGEPVSRVMVYPLRAMPGGPMQRTGGGFNQTDDMGRFRLYGLEPGEYGVAAEARGMGGPPMEGIAEGFVTTFFPSALSEREGSRVRVVAGTDTGDVEIALVRTRTFKITGTVMDSKGRPSTNPNLQLVKSTPGGGMGSSGMSQRNPDGTFTIRDVVPGDYRLTVMPWGGPPGQQPAEPIERASVPISVGADIDGLVIVTQPGVSLAGSITFAEGTPAKVPQGLHVSAQAAERMMMMGPQPNVTAGDDLQFTLKDMFGPQLIRVYGPGYTLKAVMLGATDITETPVEFKREHSGHLRIVMTSRVGTIEGAVTDDRGEPASSVMIVALPEDKAAWRTGSSRIRMGGTGNEGRYSISNLLAGRYFVVAVPRDRVFLNFETPPEIYEALAKEATAVVVGEDEKRTLDLRVARLALDR